MWKASWLPDSANSLMCSSCKASSPLLASLRHLRAFEAGAHGIAIPLAAPAVAGSSAGPEYWRDYCRRHENEPIYPLHVPNVCQECKSMNHSGYAEAHPLHCSDFLGKSSTEQ